MKNSILFAALFIITITSFSQEAAYFDPAQAYTKLLLDNAQNPNDYTRVGAFKVKGTQMLYGGGLKGEVFTKDEFAKNVSISFDTYYQQLQVKQKNTSDLIIKECKEVDSFTITTTINDKEETLFFMNAALLETGNRFFVQKIIGNGRFQLYKKYFSELGHVSTNYIEPGLRQFDLNYQYYYLDTTKNELKKLKPAINAIVKEFKPIKDISSLLDKETFNFNPETSLIKVFAELNSK